jgi:hypothetical protein
MSWCALHRMRDRTIRVVVQLKRCLRRRQLADQYVDTLWVSNLACDCELTRAMDAPDLQQELFWSPIFHVHRWCITNNGENERIAQARGNNSDEKDEGLVVFFSERCVVYRNMSPHDEHETRKRTYTSVVMGLNKQKSKKSSDWGALRSLQPASICCTCHSGHYIRGGIEGMSRN